MSTWSGSSGSASQKSHPQPLRTQTGMRRAKHLRCLESTVSISAARKCSDQPERRRLLGLRGVRIGEASHPGPKWPMKFKALRGTPLPCNLCDKHCARGVYVHVCDGCGCICCAGCGPHHHECPSFCTGPLADVVQRSSTSTLPQDCEP